MATKWYVEQILEAGCGFVNCIPVFIASENYWNERFKKADPSRPVFAVNGVQVQIAGFPEAKDAAPRGCDTAYVNTWACGPLRPNEQKTFRWSVTAVQAGDFNINWRVAAGLDGIERKLQAVVDQLQAPVVGDPCGTAVRRQGSTLPWRWIEGEPIGLSHGGQSDAFRLLETVVIAMTVHGDCVSSRWNSTAGIRWAARCAVLRDQPGRYRRTGAEPAIGTYREISTTFPAASRRSGT
jgi:hypothetical protein